MFSYKTNILSCVMFFFLVGKQDGCDTNTTSGNGCINKANIKNDPCITLYDPVCGCDGKTYSNECVAANAGVTKWEKGECNKTGEKPTPKQVPSDIDKQ